MDELVQVAVYSASLLIQAKEREQLDLKDVSSKASKQSLVSNVTSPLSRRVQQEEEIRLLRQQLQSSEEARAGLQQG